MSDISAIRSVFPGARHREFWLCTLMLFLKYYLINRKSPNEYRYWKEILKETNELIGWWFRPLAALDRMLLRLPLVNLLAWNTVNWAILDDAGES